MYLSKLIKLVPLTSLDLYGNVLRDVGAVALLQSLRQVISMIIIRIMCFADLMGKCFRQHETLTDLNLGSNDLSMESGIALARELETHKRLQKLDLGTEENAMYANRFNNMVGVAFGQTLQNNNTLKELGLNGVGIGRTAEKKEDSKFQASAALGMMLQRNTYLQAGHVRVFGKS